jgi:hypothetical protein
MGGDTPIQAISSLLAQFVCGPVMRIRNMADARGKALLEELSNDG